MLKRQLFTLVLIMFIVVLTGCDLFNPYASMVYDFDMSGSDGDARGFSRSLQNTDFNFSAFEKYEIEVVYIYIALFDTKAIPGMSYDQRTLYNTTIGNGVKINLATENLSDKIKIKIEKPQGDGIDKIYVGLGTTLTAKGYVNDNGVVYRTRSNGTLTPDGDTQPAEEGVFAVDGYEIPAFSVDEDDPPLEPNVKGIYLWLASGGKKHAGHKDLYFHGEANKVDLKFPLEMGLVNRNGQWQSCSLDWVTPYINGTSRYEKYYLKPAGAGFYTDVLRVLTDAEGNAVLGQLVIGNLATSGSLLNNHYNMWYNADDVVGLPDAEIDAIYAQWFREIDNNTFYFKAMGGMTDTVTASAFQRASHSGSLAVNGNPVSYDCIKIE